MDAITQSHRVASDDAGPESSVVTRRRRPPSPYVPVGRVVAGTLAVAFMLATTRWGSHIALGPLYLTDVLVAAAFLGEGLRSLGSRRLGATPSRSSVPPSFMFFYAWVIVRAIVGLGSVEPMDWLRDAVPFLYGALTFLAARSFSRANERQRQVTEQVLVAALLLHFFWVAATRVTGITLDLAPGVVQVPVFTIRSDIDAAFVSVLVGIACQRAIKRAAYRLGWLCVAVAGTTIVVTMASRAALLSLIAVLIVLVWLELGRNTVTLRRRALVVAALPLVFFAGVLAAANTTAGQRLLVTLGFSEAVSEQQVQGAGTASARESAWSALVDWTLQDNGRALVGAGFGVDVLHESGAEVYIEGERFGEVRSPHNWFLTVVARLGLIGLIAAVAVVVTLAAAVVRRRSELSSTPIAETSALIIVALLPVATVGVILESPFGAVPFFWCAGVIYAFGRRRTALGVGGQSLRRVH